MTHPEIDALIASDDNVAAVAGLTKTSPAERERVTRMIIADFPGFKENEDRYEAVADAEERCRSLRAFVESSAQNRAAVIAEIKVKVHDPADIPREARALENNALLLTRMGRYVLQQKIISGLLRCTTARSTQFVKLAIATCGTSPEPTNMVKPSQVHIPVWGRIECLPLARITSAMFLHDPGLGIQVWSSA